LLDLAFREAIPQPFWQNAPHLGEDWRNFLLHLATDHDNVVGDINHGTMPAYFSAFDFPHKDNFLSYLHNLLLYFWSQNKIVFGRASGCRGFRAILIVDHSQGWAVRSKKVKTSGENAFDPASMNNFGPTIRTTSEERSVIILQRGTMNLPDNEFGEKGYHQGQDRSRQKVSDGKPLQGLWNGLDMEDDAIEAAHQWHSKSRRSKGPKGEWNPGQDYRG